MARTKNRGYQQTLAPTYTARLWKMGGYIRLSREDLQKINRGLDDSNSVKNQRDILNDFHHNHVDEFESYVEYVDDGHTGTDTERESFQRLLGDVMSGKINCVVVKDLSRFARNYSDAGSLIDNLFVQMGVRFISLAEGVDSYLNPDSVNSIIVPITNVMNDQYCYQTSKKIRQVFDYKRRNGQYIGSFAPYGYIKDPKDKHQLIVDPEAAEIVKKIYEMCLQGTAKLQIVMYLNDHGIPSPTAYRKLKGLPYSPAISDAPMWGNKIITDILRNPIYTGDLVQGRRRVKSYKVHQIEAVPEEEWVRVPDTHEATGGLSPIRCRWKAAAVSRPWDSTMMGVPKPGRTVGIAKAGRANSPTDTRPAPSTDGSWTLFRKGSGANLYKQFRLRTAADHRSGGGGRGHGNLISRIYTSSYIDLLVRTCYN